MAKERERIPAKTRDQVMKEFNHRCAKCGADGPHLHHINEDPSNNDPMNLIPLCPNCHLTDQHNPTQTIDPGKLRLFRQYKDPTILTPQFHALYRRMGYLDDMLIACQREDYPADGGQELRDQAAELIELVECLEMGAFYSRRIERLVAQADHRYRECEGSIVAIAPPPIDRRAELLEELVEIRGKVQALVVELLRFQPWNVNE